MESVYFAVQFGIVILILWLFFSKNGAAKDPFSVLVPFFAFFILTYVVRSIDLYYGRTLIFGGSLEGDIGRLLFISLLALGGLSSLALGFVSLKNIGQGSLARLNSVVILPKRVLAVHLVFLLMGAVSIVTLVVKANTNPLDYISELNYYRLNVNNDVGYLKFILNLCGISGVLYFAIATASKRKVSWFLILLPFAINFLFAHRHFAVYYIFSLITVHHYLKKRIPSYKVFLIAFFVFTLNGVFSVWRDFNYQFPERALNISEIFAQYSEKSSIFDVVFMTTYLTSFHGVDSVDKIMQAIEDGADFHYGYRFLLEPIAGAIPYSVWRDKPIPLNAAVNNLMNQTEIDFYDPTERAGGVVGTVLGDLYWAGGITGIMVGMFIIGVLFRLSYRLAHSKGGFAIFAYSIYYPVLFMFISTIGSGIIRLFYFSIVIYIMYRIVRVPRKRFPREHLPNRIDSPAQPGS